MLLILKWNDVHSYYGSKVVCTTIGIFALRSVRFQKQKHASLFDQRKMGMPSLRSSRPRNIVTPGSGSKERDRGFMGNLSDAYNRSEIDEYMVDHFIWHTIYERSFTNFQFCCDTFFNYVVTLIKTLCNLFDCQLPFTPFRSCKDRRTHYPYPHISDW